MEIKCKRNWIYQTESEINCNCKEVPCGVVSGATETRKPKDKKEK